MHAAATKKLARDPVALDVRSVTTVADVLYICHGDVGRSVEAIVTAILEALQAARRPASHVEGRGGDQWVLLDLGSVMVHVFQRERRQYYGLERLWHDAVRLTLPEA